MAAFLLSGAAYSQTAGRQQLQGHRTFAASGSAWLGRHRGDSTLRLSIVLPLHNQQALDELLQGLYDPHSPLYRHFLSPAEFAQRFGATESDYAAIQDFAATHGLKVTGAFTNHLALGVEGKSSDVEKAFHVEIHDYRRFDGSVFFGPDRQPSLDTDVPVVQVAGLDNEEAPRPRLHKTTAFAGGASPRAGGSGPVVAGTSTFIGNDYRNAYASGTTLTGAGQSLDLVEFTVYTPSDVTTYEGQCNPPLNVPVSNVYLDSETSTTAIDCTAADGFPEIEVALDMEVAMAMAPGLSQVVVYMGDVPTNVLSRIASDDNARQISCSWGWSLTNADRTAQNSILAEFAAQGQSYFLASGDGSSKGVGGFIGDPPYGQTSLENDSLVTQTEVGANELTMTGTGANWSAEVPVPKSAGWQSTGGILQGTNTGDSIPGYQVGISMTANKGSTVFRNIPDVSCVGLQCYVFDCTGQDSVGGTSAATPLWAAFMALVNQQAAASGLGPVGFANPSLYAIAKGPNYTTDFHDITTGNNGTSTQFPATIGFDLATGWGSPKGQPLINDLVGTISTSTPTPTGAFTATVTASRTPTKTAIRTPTSTPSFTVTASATSSPTSTPTKTATSSATSTVSLTPTGTASATPSATASSTVSPTASLTPSSTPTSTATTTPSASLTPTATSSPTSTPTSSASFTPSGTPSSTPTSSATPSSTPTGTATSTATSTLTASATASSTPTASFTPSWTPSSTPSGTPTASGTSTPSFTPSSTATSSATPTASLTPSWTPSATASSTPTASLTMSWTPSLTASRTPTSTATSTLTASATASSTPTASFTSSWTPSSTPSGTPTLTATTTASPTPTPSATSTPTSSASATPSDTAVNTSTKTPTSTTTSTATPTASSSTTSTPTSSPTSTTTATPTLTPTPTATRTVTSTNTATATSSATSTTTSSPTSTPSWTATLTPTLTSSSTSTWTPTLTASNTPSSSPTFTPSHIFTFTPSPTPTSTASATFTPFNLSTFTPSFTPAPSSGFSVVVIPNVGPGPFQFRVNLPGPEVIILSVYDLAGERVYGATEEGTAGINLIVWNGKNQQGKTLSSGLYIYRVQAGTDQKMGKILLKR